MASRVSCRLKLVRMVERSLSSRSATRAWASTRRKSIKSSRLSTRPSRAEQGWACRSAVRSLRRIRDESGRARTRRVEARSNSHFPSPLSLLLRRSRWAHRLVLEQGELGPASQRAGPRAWSDASPFVEQPERTGELGGLPALLHVELYENVLEMRLDGLSRDIERTSDFLV